jgi:hypothetical protein
MRDIIARCEAKGLRMTEQRRVLARVIGAAEDHPDVEELHARAAAIDARISLATVYRTAWTNRSGSLYYQNRTTCDPTNTRRISRVQVNHYLSVSVDWFRNIQKIPFSFVLIKNMFNPRIGHGFKGTPCYYSPLVNLPV